MRETPNKPLKRSVASGTAAAERRIVDPSCLDEWGVRSRRRGVAPAAIAMYGECMARLTSTTVRLEEEDVRALRKARAAGHSASELVRKGLRVVASRYYSGRRPPTTGLFVSTDSKLGDESLLFKDLKD